jgi:hypothetical protein
LTIMKKPCQVNSAGQIKREPCGWTTDVQRTGNVVRCCQCASRFEWRDGYFFPAVPTLRVAGKAVATAGKIVLGLAILALGMGAVSQRDDCDCD